MRKLIAFSIIVSVLGCKTASESKETNLESVKVDSVSKYEINKDIKFDTIKSSDIYNNPKKNFKPTETKIERKK